MAFNVPFWQRPGFEEEEQLGKLAMEYRGTPSKEERKRIAGEYAQVVDRLTKSGNWEEVPAPEDQLPDYDMPQSFFDYWQKKAACENDS